MIEINLLAEELKVKLKKKASSAQSKQILFFIPVILGLLVVIHLYLLSVTLTKGVQLAALNNKWQRLQPQRTMLEDFKKEFEGVSKDASALQKLASQRIIWAEKLNKLSLDLPAGIWFREITVTRKDFNLKASVVSLQKDEMNLINRFIENLKKDAAFFNAFKTLELTSVQVRAVGGYDVTDFGLLGTFKSQ
jgi:Tfp pilus assembly protein PilN